VNVSRIAFFLDFAEDLGSFVDVERLGDIAVFITSHPVHALLVLAE